MAHIWFMHDAHLGCALFFLDMLAEYTLLSMTVMVFSCLWYVVGMKLVCPMSKFPQAPFARAPFGECRLNLYQKDLKQNCEHSAKIANTLPKLRTNWIISKQALLIQLIRTTRIGWRAEGVGTRSSFSRQSFRAFLFPFSFFGAP